MLDRAARLRILVESNGRSLDQIDSALEALETGSAERGHAATAQRGFHTIKHEAQSLQLPAWSSAAAACEAILEASRDRGLGLPLELLREASAEFRAATKAVAEGRRHRLDRRLLARLKDAAGL